MPPIKQSPILTDASLNALVRVTTQCCLAPGSQPNIGDQILAPKAVQGQDLMKSQCWSELCTLTAQSLTFRDQRHGRNNSCLWQGNLGPQSHVCEGPRPQKPECTVQYEIRDVRPADDLNESSLANTRAVTASTNFCPQSPKILLFLPENCALQIAFVPMPKP